MGRKYIKEPTHFFNAVLNAFMQHSWLYLHSKSAWQYAIYLCTCHFLCRFTQLLLIFDLGVAAAAASVVIVVVIVVTLAYFTGFSFSAGLHQIGLERQGQRMGHTAAGRVGQWAWPRLLWLSAGADTRGAAESSQVSERNCVSVCVCALSSSCRASYDDKCC